MKGKKNEKILTKISPLSLSLMCRNPLENMLIW